MRFATYEHRDRRRVAVVEEDGQIVARLAFEPMAAIPATLYGQGGVSNYQGQTLKLSKHFR